MTEPIRIALVLIALILSLAVLVDTRGRGWDAFLSAGIALLSLVLLADILR